MARVSRAASRRSKTVDGLETSEKRDFHEVDGAPRQAGGAKEAMRIISL